MAIHPGLSWIDQNWNLLPPGLWVAANASGIVAQHPEYDSMLATVGMKGISLSDVAIILVPIGVIQ